MPHIETQSEWEARMAGKILDFVRNEICVDLRFLQPAFSVLERKPDTELNAFATDGNRLYFAPEWMISVFRKNPAYLDRAYLHTILHCIFPIPGSEEILNGHFMGWRAISRWSTRSTGWTSHVPGGRSAT